MSRPYRKPSQDALDAEWARAFKGWGIPGDTIRALEVEPKKWDLALARKWWGFAERNRRRKGVSTRFQRREVRYYRGVRDDKEIATRYDRDPDYPGIHAPTPTWTRRSGKHGGRRQ